ncbi:MAG TPA: methyltransferase domain-containing protein [Thermoanaerobaculia bacterium]|nr:methyltransferase domain-containing protein [Thermoanaerobaculia bacterium]
MSSWRRARYSVYATFYDLGPGFVEERGRAISLLELRPGERVLVPGVGTGADLPLLPHTVSVLGVDLTPAMLARAKNHGRPGVELRVMNAERLELPDGSFDAVLLHQVLEVVKDPVACLAEAARVLRVGGRISVYDKFVAEDAPHGPLRAAIARAVDFVFTTSKVRFSELLAESHAPLVVEHREESTPPFSILTLRRVEERKAPR